MARTLARAPAHPLRTTRLLRRRGMMQRMYIFRPFAFATVVAAIFARVALAQTGLAPIALPSGWILERPPGAIAQTGTMPQGMSVSPDGTTIAVVEAGYNPPTLSLFRAPDL